MKVLYIGYYKENSEWGKMATNFILSMHSAGIEVVPRSISLSGNSREVGGMVQELEKGSLEDCDICIQHVFPEHLVGSDKFKKNIALLTNDAVELSHSSWIERLSMMTEVWTTNKTTKDLLQNLLEIPVKVVFPGVRKETYSKQYKEVNIDTGGRFVFYTIINNLKSLENVISTFHSEFDPSEQTSLVLFTTTSEPDFAEKINDLSTSIKSSLRLAQDPRIHSKDVIISQTGATELDIYALHSFGDCFVSSSHGDAWPMSVFDAMAFGSTPIVTEQGGAEELPQHVVRKVDGYLRVNLQEDKVSEIKNGKDYTIEPCHKAIKQQMRSAFEDWKKNPIQYTQNRKREGLQAASLFSLEDSGTKIKELINDKN